MTVDELLREVLPSDASVIAGAVGLDREVTWPATLRTRAPAFPHLKGGEIALISTEALRMHEPRLQLSAVIRSLAGLSVSAVAVAGDVPAESRDLAEAVSLPLITLPHGTHLADLEQAIARSIVDHRTQMHQRSQEIYRRLTEVAIEGRGVGAILGTLAELTGKEVVLEGRSFDVRSSVTRTAGGCRPTLLERLSEDAGRITAWLERTPITVSDPPTMRLPLDDEMGRIVAPIAVKDAVLGYLSVVGRRSALGELDELAASRGAAACAIELARERAVLEAEDRLQTDLVEALISGNYPSADAVLARAERLGFSLAGAHVALVFGQAGDGRPRALRAAVNARRLEAALERQLAQRGLRAPVGVRGERAVVLFPASQLEGIPLKALAAELRAAAAAAVEAPVSAGVGRPYPGLDGIRQSYQEADGALTLGGRFLGGGQVALFAELGLYRLLLALRSTAELDGFYQQTLGALVEYDREKDGELLKTLDAYFACLGSPTDAAERLHVHRNTLLYRLRRIQEVAGVDLNDAETRLALHLALRVRDVLQAGDHDGPTVRPAQTALG
ncbi:MAG TPA: helix-turn-helix domain-containing protein [Chloroflexota bacterium]|nr:helix-turn-helix domain-containing protein [Chloroflexota bacterium]